MENPLVRVFPDADIDRDPSNFALVKSQDGSLLVFYKPRSVYLTMLVEGGDNPMDECIVYLLEQNVEIIESMQIAGIRYGKNAE